MTAITIAAFALALPLWHRACRKADQRRALRHLESVLAAREA